jgi:hypothetical protein
MILQLLNQMTDLPFLLGIIFVSNLSTSLFRPQVNLNQGVKYSRKCRMFFVLRIE